MLSKLKCMVVTLYIKDADPEKMAIENWEALSTDIRVGDEQQQKQGICGLASKVSERHGGRWLFNHIFFSQYLQQTFAALTDTDRATTTLDSSGVQHASKMH